MSPFDKWIVIMLSLTLAACTTGDKFSFTRLGQTVDPNNGQLINPSEAPRLSDGLALNYASSVASILRAKFNGARITNEVASTLQVTLAALAGAGAAFDFGASAVTALGLSSARPGSRSAVLRRGKQHGIELPLRPTLEQEQDRVFRFKNSERRIEPSEPPLTRPINPDEQRGFPPPEDWAK